MCGLAGTVAPAGVDRAALAAMGEAVRHRGPDGHGYLLWRPGEEPRMQRDTGRPGEPAVLGLAHRRLSIIDLGSHNDQPMVSGDGTLALSYNGEIYNYLELRRELERLGHSFRTDGDTEVLLAAYTEWGPGCVERMIGMWAFAMLDAPRRRLMLSRDRFGIKPLYWTRADGALHFASEIKGLLAAPGVDPEPDAGIVRRYLLTGAAEESERTFYEGIRSLPAAHNAFVGVDDAAEPRLERYWSVPPEGSSPVGEEAAERLLELFSDSVRIHARSDVPVGTCLSGGLDSSAIVCVAEELRERDAIPRYAHSGFGYVPEDPEQSERHHMEAVVRSTGIRMTYVEVGDERFADALPEVARAQDEPFFSPSVAAQYHVFEAARDGGMKVMLDGQGADEVLGGYHHMFEQIAAALLRRGSLGEYARWSRAFRRDRGRAPIGLRGAAFAIAPDRMRRGAAARAPRAAALLGPGLRGGAPDQAPQRFGSVHDVFAAHVTTSGLPALLRFEDRNSMAHSIEARVPFLDHRIVELAFRMPWGEKVRGGSPKDVLRRAMRGVVPDDIIDRRDKIGFRADPAAAWRFAERHRAALLESRTQWEREWIDPAGVAALLDGADRSSGAEFSLWRAVNLKLWLRSHWGDGDWG